MLKRILTVIAALLCASAWAERRTCEDTLKKETVHGDSKLQEQIRAKADELHKLELAYRQQLGPYQDPFALAFRQEQANEIYERLALRERNGQMRQSPLAIMNFNLKREYAESRALNWKLVEWMEADAKWLLEQKRVERAEVQGELLALMFAQDYLRRFRMPETVVDRDGKAQDGDKKDQKKDEKKNQKDQPPQKNQNQQKSQEQQQGEGGDGGEQDQPPEYPDLPKEYQPHTKDTPKSSKGKQKEHRIVDVNFKTAYFAMGYFADISRHAVPAFKEGVLPIQPKSPAKFKRTERNAVVRTFGKRQVELAVPPGHKPLQPSDPRAVITRVQSGSYVLNLQSDMQEVHVPLEESESITLPPPLRDTYTRPVGFKPEEWPADLKAEILHKIKPEDGEANPLRVAQAIQAFFHKHYLYSVGARPEKDPIEALKAGAFQCDMAAFAMAGLTRDIYKIPTRIGRGYRAKRHKSADGNSYLIFPAEGHAWVEIFADGKWHVFDPTPVKKDQKSKNQNGDSEYANVVPDGQSGEQDDEQQEQESQDSDSESGQGSKSQEGKDSKSESKAQAKSQSQPDHQPGKSSGQGQDKKKSSSKPKAGGKSDEEAQKDHQKKVDEATAKRTAGVPAEKKGNAGGPGPGRGKGEGGKEQGGDNTKAEGGERLTNDELADQLELGSLELEPTPERNPLVERAMRVLLQIALEPTRRGQDTQNRLSQMASLLRRFPSAGLKQLTSDAQVAHAADHPALKSWIEQVANLLDSTDVNKSYQEIFRILQSVEIYARTLDHNGKVPYPSHLISSLSQILLELNKLKHPDTKEIALVDDMVKNLPPVVRQLLKKDFNLDIVGPNAPTKAIAKMIRSGKMEDLRLLSILAPLSDFILNSTPRPEMVDVKTWERDTRRTRAWDLLPLERFSDMARALFAQPGKSVQDNLREGTVFVPSRRKIIQVPAGYGSEEAERITIVLYDTSGSMLGHPGQFQAGLISAFTARALSDLSPSGKHRHRVVIVPFADAPGNPVRVTNTQEALDIIRNYQSKLANTGGGTDIQAALLQAMALIADAEKRSGEPLAAANIVLMTDGQAPVDTKALAAAREAIDRRTPLQTMFIAINQTNEDLMRYAMDSRAMGVEKGFYREFNSEVIEDVIKQARTIREIDNAFFTEKNAAEIPPSVHRLLDQAMRQSADFTSQVMNGARYIPANDHLESLERLKWRDAGHADRMLEKWLMKLRQLVMHAAFDDRNTLERVNDDILTVFERVTGVKMNELADYEQENLRHFIRYAAGLEGKQ